MQPPTTTVLLHVPRSWGKRLRQRESMRADSIARKVSIALRHKCEATMHEGMAKFLSYRRSTGEGVLDIKFEELG